MASVLNSTAASKACLNSAYNPATFEGAKLWVETYLYESSDLNTTDKAQPTRVKNLSALTGVPADKVMSTFLNGSRVTQWVRESLVDVIKKKSESYGCQYNHRGLCRLEQIALA